MSAAQLIEEGQNVAFRMLGSGKRGIGLWARQTLPRYKRNRDCWFRGVDISALSVWNSLGGVRRAGTLVGKGRRWMVFAQHYQITKGTVCRFVDPTGQPEERTVVDTVTHPHYTRHPTFCDLQFALLDEPTSERIRPMPILPVELLNDMPVKTHWHKGPILTMAGLTLFATDQQEHILFLEGTFLQSGMSQAEFNRGEGDTYESTEFGFNTPWTLGEEPLAVSEPRVSGDSGSPVFAIHNGCPNLCAVMTGGGSGTSIPHEFGVIQQMGVDVFWG